MYSEIDVSKKQNIVVGLIVDIVEDKNKHTQEVTRGYVKRVISNSDRKKGIKVELTSAAIGTVVGVPLKAEIEKEMFKFYNIFFYQEHIFALWSKKENQYFVISRKNTLTNQMEKTLLLFSDKNLAESTIKGTSLDNKNFSIRAINRRKPIFMIFNDYKIDFYSIDMKHKLSKERFRELEKRFKSF